MTISSETIIWFVALLAIDIFFNDRFGEGGLKSSIMGYSVLAGGLLAFGFGGVYGMLIFMSLTVAIALPPIVINWWGRAKHLFW